MGGATTNGICVSGLTGKTEGLYFLNDRGNTGSPSKKRQAKAEADKIAGKINELYRSFMQSYVRSINESTFKVTIGGVRIGNAKYSRLAQINLKSRIITFSRYAIENVPERGRRYLVLHELAHVLEASHNKHFWNLVEFHEPQYKEIGLALDRAFKKNVQKHERLEKQNAEQTLENAVRDLNLAAAKDLIWTPDHGFIESGDRSFGLHRDQLRLFTSSADGRHIDEGFNEYLALKNEDDDELEPNLILDPHERALAEWENFMKKDPQDDLDSYEIGSDSGQGGCFENSDDYFDDDYLYGTMSGGD